MNNIYQYTDIKESVVFCGAGISKNSGLPLANELQRYFLQLLNVDQDDIDRILNSKIPFEVFMSEIKGLSLDSWLLEYLLDIYNFGEPNTNHIFLAKLAKHKLVKTFITTNFDMLIEKAFEIEGLCKGQDYDVIYKADDLNINDERTQLLKIHGSIENIESIKITIDDVAKCQKSNSLSNVINTVFNSGTNKKVIILGYSCSDVFDIIPLIQNNNSKNIIIIDHIFEGENEEIIDLKNPQMNHPLKNSEGYVVKLNLNKYIKEIWERYNQDFGSYILTINNFDWKDQFMNELFIDQHSLNIIKFSFLGRIYDEMGVIDKSIYFKEELLHNIYDDEKFEKTSCYLTLSIAYQKVGLFKKSLKYSYNGLKISKQMKNKELTSKFFTEIANGYFGVYLILLDKIKLNKKEKQQYKIINKIYDKVTEKKYRLSIKYYHKKAIKTSVILKDYQGIACSLSNLGKLYTISGNDKKSLNFFFKSYSITSKNGLLLDEHLALKEISKCYAKIKDYENVDKYLPKSITIASKLNNKFYESIAFRDAGEIYQKINRPYTAYDCFIKSIIIAEENCLFHLAISPYLKSSYILTKEIMDCSEIVDTLDNSCIMIGEYFFDSIDDIRKTVLNFLYRVQEIAHLSPSPLNIKMLNDWIHNLETKKI